MENKNAAEKKFEAYPVRRMRVVDNVWQAFEKHKKQSGKTWSNFLKELGYGNETVQKVRKK